MMEEHILTRYCSKCGETKPLTPEFFHRDRAESGGFQYWCKACNNARDRRKRDSILTKRCTKCGEEFPATSEYFVVEKRHKSGLGTQCRTCKNREKKAYEKSKKKVPEGYKLCSKCGEIKPVDDFYPHKDRGKMRWHSSCKECHRKIANKAREAKRDTFQLNGYDQTDISELQEIALIMGSKCDSCGREVGNIRGDIDEKTHQRYGYLCARCHRLLLASDADPDRMHNVLKYIEKTRITQV